MVGRTNDVESKFIARSSNGFFFQKTKHGNANHQHQSHHRFHRASGATANASIGRCALVSDGAAESQQSGANADRMSRTCVFGSVRIAARKSRRNHAAEAGETRRYDAAAVAAQQSRRRVHPHRVGAAEQLRQPRGIRSKRAANQLPRERLPERESGRSHWR